MAEQIEHSGVVSSVEGRAVHVKILSVSACGSCKARQACGLAEAQEKIVTVYSPRSGEFKPGDEVMVGVRRGAGALAVLLAYVGALVVLLAVLGVAIEVLEWGEGLSAAAALLAVLVYYIMLWLARKQIEHTIHFTINKN